MAICGHAGGVRSSYFAGWAIYAVNADGKKVVTDPKAHWTDHGLKVISLFKKSGSFSEKRAAALDEAKAWVKERYGLDGPWVRNRMHDYVLASVNQRFPIRREGRRS